MNYRIIERGYRELAKVLIPCGLQLEKQINGLWVYVDVLPDREACLQVITNAGGTLVSK